MEILTIVLLVRKRPIKQTEKYLPQLLMNIQSPLKDIIKPWWSMSLEDVSYFLQFWFRLYSNATLFEKEYQWKEKQETKTVRKKTRDKGHLSKSDSFTHLNFVNGMVWMMRMNERFYNSSHLQCLKAELLFEMIFIRSY